MIKRQFYALEHSNRGDSGSSTSSSSLATASDGEGGPDVEDDGAWPASSHESDTSSEEKVVEAKGATSAERTSVAFDVESEESAERSDGEVEAGIELWEEKRKKLSNQWAEAVDLDETERVLDKFENSSVICVGANKQVFKCRLCPKVVCLSEESMQAHLSSKGHGRSLKQLAEGRLKVQLDSEGEEDEEGETHAERFARTVTAAQEDKLAKRKHDTGRQRQRKRLKRKALLAAKEVNLEPPQVIGKAGWKHRSGKGGGKPKKSLPLDALNPKVVPRSRANSQLAKREMKKLSSDVRAHRNNSFLADDPS